MPCGWTGALSGGTQLDRPESAAQLLLTAGERRPISLRGQLRRPVRRQETETELPTVRCTSIAIGRLRTEARTRAYVQRRITEGHSKA
jgi:hypothetical protein